MKRAGVDEKSGYELTFNNNWSFREGQVQQSSDRRAIRRIANYIEAHRDELVPAEIEAQRQEMERLHVQVR